MLLPCTTSPARGVTDVLNALLNIRGQVTECALIDGGQTHADLGGKDPWRVGRLRYVQSGDRIELNDGELGAEHIELNGGRVGAKGDDVG